MLRGIVLRFQEWANLFQHPDVIHLSRFHQPVLEKGFY
jgi:hypothetical protein